MQDKTRIFDDLGTPAEKKEQSLRVLCAYKKAMLATGASGRLSAQNDRKRWRLHVFAAASRPRRTDLLRTAVAFVVVVCRA